LKQPFKNGMMTEEKTKSFSISKQMVYDSYLRVCENQGSAGVDKQSIEAFNEERNKNLYKIWNRMSSGSYFAPSVRRVEIPKKGGGVRPLGIPTVGDRIAQGVVKGWLEPIVEPLFHSCSYGYRPGKSAHDALKMCTANCKKLDWVVDIDIKGFFDNINHEKLLQMVAHHAQEKWVLLYVERWLKAGVEQADKSIKANERGTPQGGVISPLLANIYLHHCFDMWMQKYYANAPFERYADDIVIHCSNKEQALAILSAVSERMQKFDLTLHPDKTKIVHCYKGKDTKDRTDEHRSFVFLSYSFEPRRYCFKEGTKTKIVTRFHSAICNNAKKSIRDKINLFFNYRWINISLEDLAKRLNPRIRGWMNYYSLYNKNKVNEVIMHVNVLLQKWLKSKYRERSTKKVVEMYKNLIQSNSRLFYHWIKGITNAFNY
jgi:RNA-directed DNA polymerase